MKQRKRPSDPQTKKVFDALEQRERGVGQSEHELQVDICLKISDAVIENSGTIEELLDSFNNLLRKQKIN